MLAKFTYVTAVTRLKGDAAVWEKHRPFEENLRGNLIKILTLQEMLSDLYMKTDTSMASSEIWPTPAGNQGIGLEAMPVFRFPVG